MSYRLLDRFFVPPTFWPAIGLPFNPEADHLITPRAAVWVALWYASTEVCHYDGRHGGTGMLEWDVWKKLREYEWNEALLTSRCDCEGAPNCEKCHGTGFAIANLGYDDLEPEFCLMFNRATGAVYLAPIVEAHHFLKALWIGEERARTVMDMQVDPTRLGQILAQAVARLQAEQREAARDSEYQREREREYQLGVVEHAQLVIQVTRELADHARKLGTDRGGQIAQSYQQEIEHMEPRLKAYAERQGVELK